MDYSDFHHIVRTTAQWADRSVANVSIERGVLCIELTPDGHTKLKVGEGNKYYRQLPYIDGSGGGDLSNYYTKAEINRLLATLNCMAVVSTEEYISYGRLPRSGNKLGDVRFVHNDQSNNPLIYMWNGERWIPFSEAIQIDLSAYAKKSEVNPRLNTLEEKAHTHPNKPVLDATTASYTTEEKEKLTELENYVLPVATTDTLGGVKVGTGLSIDSSGVLSATGGGGGGNEYVAGDGISIDTGTGSTDLTVLTWEQGSIDSATGLDDDTVDAYIRSPEITAGLTSSIGLTAQDTSSDDLLFKIAFYDSNHQFISMTPSFLTYADMANKPLGASYIRIVLTLDQSTQIDENDLGYCELSYPIEAGKRVITNTGVTHIELNNDNELISIENGNTDKIMTFGSDFDVTDGTVQVADWNRLILNIEE